MRRTYVYVHVRVVCVHMCTYDICACVATVYKHANKQHPYVTSVG